MKKHMFLLELILLCVVVIIPLSVQAGVFSSFFDTQNKEDESTFLHIDSNAQNVTLLKAAINTDPNPVKGGGDIIVEDGVLIPGGDIDGRSTKEGLKSNNGEVSVYIVREADTLSQIAEMYEVSAKTILWANDISDPSTIHPGDTLVILPINGVSHIVKKGDTLKSIVKKYEGDIDTILAYNQISESDALSVGDTVVVPGGKVKTATPLRSVASGGSSSGGSAWLSSPLPGAVRTQGIHGYNGVDLAAPAGTPIIAAASGRVVVSRPSGWNGGYGLYVVVRHSNGVQTLYSHMNRTAVAIGDYVNQGQVVGYVGSTGHSTGNHLHFEVRGSRNPF